MTPSRSVQLMLKKKKQLKKIQTTLLKGPQGKNNVKQIVSEFAQYNIMQRSNLSPV